LKILILALALQQPFPVQQEALPRDPPQIVISQGQLVVIDVPSVWCQKPLTFLGEQYGCRPDHKIVVGADLKKVAPGINTLAAADGSVVARITIVPVQWPEERRPAPKTVAAPQDIVEADKVALDRAYSAHVDPALSARHLQYPLRTPLGVQPPISDPFGMHRTYVPAKGDPYTSIHGGVDLAVPVGTPVWTMAPGVAVLVRSLWRGGLTVIIYHGDGVYTAYLHLSKAEVREGQQIPQGEMIGLSGNSSGARPVGAHLHWAMRIRDARVDPIEGLALLVRGLEKN
jgi:murein DD-endopeptidase MepM/ murein hydrolase activator NlpD